MGGGGKSGPHFIATCICSQHQLTCLLLFLLSVVAAYYVEIMSTSVVLATACIKLLKCNNSIS